MVYVDVDYSVDVDMDSGGDKQDFEISGGMGGGVLDQVEF